MKIKNEILKTIKYFSFFDYKPTPIEIYMFLLIKISKKMLESGLNSIKYTPPQYSIRRTLSQKKLENWRFKTYIKLLSFFPQIKLVGLSGSISMMNAEENDDLDLFVITAKNRLFTGRFIALVLAQILGLRRSWKAPYQKFFNGKQKTVKNLVSSLSVSKDYSSIRNKVCLNLFFDESGIKVPRFKQTEFVGHEILQMKPIVNKDHIYERFLRENNWVFSLFPNSEEIVSIKYPVSSIHKQNTKYFILDTFSEIIESFLKKYQRNLISRHRTSEIITEKQLWFHPDDFEKKLPH